MSLLESDILNPSSHPSPRLFLPKKGVLMVAEGARAANGCPHAAAVETRSLLERARSAEAAIGELISKKNYPCIAAIRSYHDDDYQVGLYGRIGHADTWRELRRDLLFFLQEQKKSASIYLTFWAIFEPGTLSEDDFERAMWAELSALTSEESKDQDWRDPAHADPSSKEFRFSLEGSEFFVVGLHPQSSRLGRRFSRPALVFNVFEQFEELERQGAYGPMVAQNRIRDTRFQGSVNPMVAEHGDEWEAIQFSGKVSGPEWKCPFRFVKSAEKP